MRPVKPTDSLHAIYMNCGILCVECRACGHRKALQFTDGLTRGRSNEYIFDLKLKCSGCGGKEIARHLPANAQDAAEFVSAGR